MRCAAAPGSVAEKSAARIRLKPAQVAVAVELSAKLAPRAALRLLVQGSFAHLCANVEGVLRSRDPEYVHQMRVAVRRMRCAVRLFPPPIRGGRPAGLNKDLRKLSGLLGAVRDTEILRELLARANSAIDPDLEARAQAMLADRTEATLKALRAYLKSAGHAQFVSGIDRWITQAVQDMPGESNLMRLAQRRLTKWHCRIACAARKPLPARAADLHRLRIQVKRVRYAAEFFGSLYDQGAVRQYVHLLAKVQDKLGGLTDIKTCRALLRELGLGEETKGVLAEMRHAAPSRRDLHALITACRDAGGYWLSDLQGSHHV